MMLRAYDLCVCRDFSDSAARENPALVAGLHYLVLSGQAVKILYVRTSTKHTDSIIFYSLLPVMISFGLLLLILTLVRLMSFFSNPHKSPLD